MKNIYSHIADGIIEKKNLVIATIIETKGSTPQIPGASALINNGNIWKGTLGGGVLESAAQKRAKEASISGKSVLFEYHLDADIAAAEGAICGGIATLLIDVQPEKQLDVFNEIHQSVVNKIPGILITIIRIQADKKVNIQRFWSPMGTEIPDEKFHDHDISAEVKKSLTERKTRLLKIPGDSASQKEPGTMIYFEPIGPMPSLIIAGAGHIGQAIAHLASLLEFEVTVIDDRPEFANPARFPDSDHIIVKEIGPAMNELTITPETYIVLVTRGHKHDAEALKTCIRSNAGYVGMIGSSRKVNQMRKEFIAQGWATPEQFDRIHAPIGIEISSRSIQEIAISIAAQMVQARHRNQNHTPHISAIVLAAGESTRMKEPKLLLPYLDKPMIQTIVDTVVQSKVNEVLVVLGADQEKIKKALADSSVTFCTNRDYRKGMLSSIQTGFNSLPDRTHACMVFLGDQPMITSGIIDAVIDAYHQSKKGIVIPVYKKRRGHPVLIDIKYKVNIDSLDPEVGLRELIRKFPDDVAEVEVGYEGILRDIDTKEDYINEINKIKSL